MRVLQHVLNLVKRHSSISVNYIPVTRSRVNRKAANQALDVSQIHHPKGEVLRKVREAEAEVIARVVRDGLNEPIGKGSWGGQVGHVVCGRECERDEPPKVTVRPHDGKGRRVWSSPWVGLNVHVLRNQVRKRS
jgi:hypothetical protein